MTRPFHLVDVFADRRWSGNPLAVVLDAGDLDAEAMQRIATETNLSETAFAGAARERDGGHRVRLFTPAREIAFAGHPILGTGWVLRHHLAGEASKRVRLNLTFGQVAVEFETAADGAETVWFNTPEIEAGPICSPQLVAPALGLSNGDIEAVLPIQRFSAGGTCALIVPLRGLDALRRSRLDLARFAPLAAHGHAPLVYLFCRQTHDPGNDLCARFFFEANGVREDPATGNGAAFLGAWLLLHRVFPGRALDLRIEQGHEIGRPSRILLRAATTGHSRRISIGGRVIPSVRGELL